MITVRLNGNAQRAAWQIDIDKIIFSLGGAGDGGTLFA